MLTIPRHPSSRPPRCWQSQRLLTLSLPSLSFGLPTELADEATLSPELRTPPLPATHVWVGYWWQNTR